MKIFYFSTLNGYDLDNSKNAKSSEWYSFCSAKSFLRNEDGKNDVWNISLVRKVAVKWMETWSEKSDQNSWKENWRNSNEVANLCEVT